MALLSGSHSGQDPNLAEAGHGTRVKVCGIVEPTEVDVLAAHQIDFVGLWGACRAAHTTLIVNVGGRWPEPSPPGV